EDHGDGRTDRARVGSSARQAPQAKPGCGHASEIGRVPGLPPAVRAGARTRRGMGAAVRRGGRTMTALARSVLALLALAASAWLVHVFGRVLPTWAAALVWLGLAVPITIGRARCGRLRCAGFRQLYLAPDGTLARRFGGGALIYARAALIGGVLGLVLYAALVRLEDTRAWVTLVAGAPATAFAFALWRRALASQLAARYLPEIAWRLTLLVVGAGLAAALVALAFHRPYPDLGDVGLERAVWHFVDQERARSA